MTGKVLFLRLIDVSGVRNNKLMLIHYSTVYSLHVHDPTYLEHPRVFHN